jgi:hypothetical protein
MKAQKSLPAAVALVLLGGLVRYLLISGKIPVPLTPAPA